MLFRGLFFFFICTNFSFAQTGEFRFHSFFLSTDFIAGENSNNSTGLHLRDAFLEFSWESQSSFGAQFKLGKSERNKNTTWFASTEDKSIFEEAYLYYHGDGYSFEMGLMPVEFGLASKEAIEESLISQALIYSQRYLSDTDLGMKYKMQTEGLEASMMLHNGEGIINTSQSQNDDKYFFTANLVKQWTKRDYLGASAQVGQYLTKSSVNAVNHKLRMNSLYGAKSWGALQNYTEIVLGEEKIDKDSVKFHFGRLDFLYIFSDRFAGLVRYETTDPNTKNSGDKVNVARVGLILFSNPSNSRFSFSMSQRKTESGQKDNVGMIQWSMGSKAFPVF